MLLSLSAFLACNLAFGQVNLQTGSATFSLPMFNWQDQKSNLTTSIGLSYNSGSGLKVNDVASEVGQGWSLVAGGVITRMQVGEPDDQVQYGNGQPESFLQKNPNGYLYANKKAYGGCPPALAKYPIYGAKNQFYKQYNEVTEDRQLDYFAFQFNGKAGIFVLNAAPNNPSDLTQEDIGLPLGDTKLKIKFQRNTALLNQGMRTTIESFTIQDIDGLIYTFSKYGRARLLDTKYCDQSGKYLKRQPDFKRGKVYYQNDFPDNSIHNPDVITSWYLTEIKDPLTLRTVSLTYSDENINAFAGTDLTYNQSSHYSTIAYKQSVAVKPRLESIVYPDGHLVAFHYDKLRVDLPATSALTSVDIMYKASYFAAYQNLSKYLINTTYFILNRYGTPVTDYQKSVARLCLKSVQKIGPYLKEDSPPYVFDYYTGSDASGDFVPPPFYFKKDAWGYYNGDKSVDSHWDKDHFPNEVNELNNEQIIGLCFLREIQNQNNNYTKDLLNVKADYAKNGLLKQIIYPTGGTLSYTYAQNKGYPIGYPTTQLQTVGGVHVSETNSTDGGYSNSCGNPVKTVYSFVLDPAQVVGESSSLWGVEMPVNSFDMSSFYKPEERKYRWPIVSGSLFGKCTYNYLYPGILSIQQATNLSDFMRAMEAISPTLGVIGSVSSVLNAIQVFTTSTGVLAIVSLAIDVITGIYTVIQTCSDQAKTTQTKIYHNYDLNSANPLPAQFKRVEIVDGSGAAGKTVHEFTSDVDFSIWEPSNLTFSSKQRFAPWAYGLPTSTKVLKPNGDIVKATYYKYDSSAIRKLLKWYSHGYGGANASNLSSNLISCNCQVLKTSSQKSSDYNDPAQYNGNYRTTSDGINLNVEMYGYYTGHVNLVRVQEQAFNEKVAGKYTETNTYYTYNDVSSNGYDGSYNYNAVGNYEVNSIATTQSNGDVLKKVIEYTATGGNLSDPVMTKLIDNNIVSLPIRTVTYLQRKGSWNDEFLSDSRTEFVQLSNGAIKPSRQLEKRYSSPNAAINSDNYFEVKSFTYDASGNITVVRDEGGRTVSNVYDYDDKYITATVVNANASTDKLAYTSFETPSLGGWSASGTPSYSTTNKVTGERGLQLTGGSAALTAPLNAALSYRLSFWATTALTISGGGVQVVAAPTINGFTYYEYEFSSGSISVSISGAGIIDEVRLYPKGARMSSVTYDPILGKTSECDANNRITYYEYDNLGRMRFIKDEKRNIVKMYEYSNATKQTGCPAVYYSHYTDEVFTPVSCGAGWLPTPYHYTIAAGKYISTISQEDADAQVQKELLTLGQTAADANPGCRPLYCNDSTSIVVYPENCGIGYKGNAVTYKVPAGRYCTTVSKDSANILAMEDLNANAQAIANDPAYRTCVVDYDPFWEADATAPTQCQWENGQAYIFILATDINPNSLTYGSTSWKNTGEPGNCAAPACDASACAANGSQFKCINGSCEAGIRVYTGTVYMDGLYYCTYHYEWSDGSQSGTYYEGGTNYQAVCFSDAV